jgi:hypothetical protein
MSEELTNLMNAVDAVVDAGKMSPKMKKCRENKDGVALLLISPTLVDNLKRARDEYIASPTSGYVKQE